MSDLSQAPPDHRVRSRRVLVLMAATILLYSWVPPAIDIGAANSNPVLFGGAIVAGQAAGALLYIYFRARGLLTDSQIRSVVWRHVLSFTTILIVANSVQSVLFVYSTRLVDTAVTSLLELHPIIYIYLMARYVKDRDGGRRYAKITPRTVLLLIVALMGVTFVTLGSRPNAALAGLDTIAWTVGLLLALASAIFRSLAAFTFKWGTDLHREVEKLRDSKDAPHVHTSVSEMDCVMFAYFLGNALASIVSVVVGFAFPFRLGGIQISFSLLPILVAFLIGFVLFVPGNICFRKANLITNNVSINALLYFTPFVSVLWLYLFTTIEIPHPDLMAIGAAAIVSANVLLHLNPEQRADMSSRLGFRSLVLFIWLFGSLVYLRDQIVEPDMLIWGGNYYGILALAATVFTLILSFRTSRLVDRTFKEEEYTISLVRNLEDLVESGIVEDQITDRVLSIDASGQSKFTVRDADDRTIDYDYQEALMIIQDAERSNCRCSYCERLMRAKIDLDKLVHSKQYGNEVGEFFAVMLFGIVTVGLSIFARPEASGWEGFLTDQFSILFSATICFLIFNLVDMLRDRRLDVFRRISLRSKHSIYFRERKTMGFEGATAMTLGLGIALTFSVLLYLKWLA